MNGGFKVIEHIRNPASRSSSATGHASGQRIRRLSTSRISERTNTPRESPPPTARSKTAFGSVGPHPPKSPLPSKSPLGIGRKSRPHSAPASSILKVKNGNPKMMIGDDNSSVDEVRAVTICDRNTDQHTDNNNDYSKTEYSGTSVIDEM